MWLDTVRKQLGDQVRINWRRFALEQQNRKDVPEGWKAWEQGPEYESRGLLALRSGEAARRQGEELQWSYSLALLRAKHEDRKDVRELSVLLEVATDVGLDLDRFKKDIEDPETLEAIARDHEEAEAQGIFGTPTYVFNGGRPAFLKMFAPPEDKAIEVWRHISALASDLDVFGELKRPQPPWPKGIFEPTSA